MNDDCWLLIFGGNFVKHFDVVGLPLDELDAPAALRGKSVEVILLVWLAELLVEITDKLAWMFMNAGDGCPPPVESA